MRILLLYPPLQFAPGAFPKPDGSLGLAYVAGALIAAGYDVEILDAAVDEWGLYHFDHREELPSGLVRVGISDVDILFHAQDYDVIGVGSTFTSQHTMALRSVKLLHEVFPQKLVMVGGVNARYFSRDFLDAGADVVFVSEAEREVVEVVRRFERGSRDFTSVPGVAGSMRAHEPITDLDELPMPAWDSLPLGGYWRIGRPHGGVAGESVRYAAMMTSRGCPYSCSFCHISVEGEGSPTGNIGRFRVKSLDRVLEELYELKSLGVERLYIEDDSLLAKKQRILEIFEAVAELGFSLADVNGVNIAHLYKNERGALVPDVELIEAMAASGFTELSLPFESASERILKAYASRKWSPSRVDTCDLIKEMKRVGMTASGNYMLGFPDETEEEIRATLDMARAHRAAGLDEANFFIVVPFPGTKLFDIARRDGYLADDWNPDDMLWFKPIMRNTVVPHEKLKTIRDGAWREMNNSAFVETRQETAI